MKSTFWVAVSFGCLALAGSAFGQERAPLEQPPAEDRAADGSRGPEVGPDALPARMQEMLRRRLESVSREEQAIREALAMLDRGEPASTVKQFLSTAIREEIRQRGPAWREGFRPEGVGPPPDDGAGGPIDGRPGEPRMPPPAPGGLGDAGPRPLERLMGVLRETDPRMFERLSRLRRENPAEFQRLLDEFAPRLGNLARERERSPERWPDRLRLMRLQREMGPAVRRTLEAPPEDHEEALGRLRALLGEQFDLRMKLRKMDLEDRREQDERAHREIEEFERDREGEIERRMMEMLEHAKRGPPPPRHPPVP
jgi:hypothetical protein